MDTAKEICEKLGIEPNLVVKKKIRGLPGILAIDLIFSLIYSENMREATDILGYNTTGPIATASRFLLHPYFPDRTQYFFKGGSVRSWRTELLAVISKKYCPSCKNIKDLSLFRNHNGRALNKSSSCSSCMTADNKKYKLYLIQRTPIWAQLHKIKEVYIKCPPDMEVDHIIPLKGELVSGLHVHNNLQYLYPVDNHIKNNKYHIED